MSELPKVVAPLILPDNLVTEKELRQWRTIVYRRCEEPLIRQFFSTYVPSVSLPKEQDWFWCYIYTAIRVLTRFVVSAEDIRSSKRPEREDFDDTDTHLMPIDGLAYRAQIWLDRHGIAAAVHRGSFTRLQLTYQLPKELYAELVPVPLPRSHLVQPSTVAVSKTS